MIFLIYKHLWKKKNEIKYINKNKQTKKKKKKKKQQQQKRTDICWKDIDAFKSILDG